MPEGNTIGRRGKALIIILSLLIHAVSIFLMLTLLHHETPKLETCISPSCLQEASRLVYQADFTAKPCENFYEYACGNYYKQAFNEITEMNQEIRIQFMDLYNESMQHDDHKMVRTMKKLYQACLREKSAHPLGTNVEQIKQVLKLAGGWPMLEGANWDETNFDWLQATYRFRELGLKFSVFLDVAVMVDPRNRSQHILKVSLPKQKVPEKRIMAEVALALGADESRTTTEIDDVYILMEYLFQNGVDNYILDTVSEYQNRQKFKIDWLDIINRIVGPAIGISENDAVIFTQSEQMVKRLDVLWNVRERVLANYMIWRVIEDIAPELILYVQRNRENSFSFFYLDKKEMCLNQIHHRFKSLPNPMDVVYLKKHFPYSNLRQVTDIITYIWAEFQKMLKKAKWMDANDKRSAVKVLGEVPVLIGAPKVHFESSILDMVDVDMADEAALFERAERESFLNLLLIVTRNYRTFSYMKLTRPVAEAYLFEWNILDSSNVLLNLQCASNMIELPAAILQGFLFNSARPNYMNFGSLGPFIAGQYVNQFIYQLAKWSVKAHEGIKKILACLKKGTDALNSNEFVLLNSNVIVLRHALATNISYSAYKKWENHHGAEAKLPSIPSTNMQLFWVSAASGFCRSARDLRVPYIRNATSFVLYISGAINMGFAETFDCPVGSIMNPVDRCDLF